MHFRGIRLFTLKSQTTFDFGKQKAVRLFHTTFRVRL
nr:MAG TPA: hypothetical protein [Caudoviricetes sp.]